MSIGERVTVRCGVYLWDGVVLEDDVYVGPCVAFTNDPYPRSKKYLREYARTILKRGCSIGANATILPGIIIGRWSTIGRGVNLDPQRAGLRFGRRQPCQTQRLDLSMRKAVAHR